MLPFRKKLAKEILRTLRVNGFIPGLHSILKELVKKLQTKCNQGPNFHGLTRRQKGAAAVAPLWIEEIVPEMNGS